MDYGGSRGRQPRGSCGCCDKVALRLHLASYAEAFEEQGFDSLPHLLRASEANVVELFAGVGMTKLAT